MRCMFALLLALTAAGCVQPKQDAGPAPLPAHPAGAISKGELPPPAKSN